MVYFVLCELDSCSFDGVLMSLWKVSLFSISEAASFWCHLQSGSKMLRLSGPKPKLHSQEGLLKTLLLRQPDANTHSQVGKDCWKIYIWHITWIIPHVACLKSVLLHTVFRLLWCYWKQPSFVSDQHSSRSWTRGSGRLSCSTYSN